MDKTLASLVTKKLRFESVRSSSIIFARAVLLELKIMVKILIRSPLKDFLSSFSPIKSLNSSNIERNMSLMVSPKLLVESLSSTGSSKNFCICSIILFTIRHLGQERGFRILHLRFYMYLQIDKDFTFDIRA